MPNPAFLWFERGFQPLLAAEKAEHPPSSSHPPTFRELNPKRSHKILRSEEESLSCDTEEAAEERGELRQSLAQPLQL